MNDHVPLISVDAGAEGIAGEGEYYSQRRDPLTPAEFVEQFSTTVFINILAMVTAGIPPGTITVHTGRDGCLQRNIRFGVIMFVPAMKPVTRPLQMAITRCVARLFDDWSRHRLDPVALEAAKERNGYENALHAVRHTVIHAGNN